jgi:hypothetical protein
MRIAQPILMLLLASMAFGQNASIRAERLELTETTRGRRDWARSPLGIQRLSTACSITIRKLRAALRDSECDSFHGVGSRRVPERTVSRFDTTQNSSGHGEHSDLSGDSFPPTCSSRLPDHHDG